MKKQLSNVSNKDIKFKHFVLKSGHSITVHKSFLDDDEIKKFNGVEDDAKIIFGGSNEAEKERLAKEKAEAEKAEAEKAKQAKTKNTRGKK